MMKYEVIAPTTFARLDDVEAFIGLPFFSDQQQETLLRDAPEQLPPDSFTARRLLYESAIDLLAQEQQGDQLHEPSAPTSPSALQDQLLNIRGALMLLDEGLQPPAVRGLLTALHTKKQTSAPRVQPRTRKQPSALPPTVMPVSAVDGMLDIGVGSARVAADYHGVPSAKIKLPGPAKPEVCVDWTFIRRLAERHGFRDPEQVIDWDRLPQGPDDTNAERIAYAREIQVRFVNPYKLANLVDERGGTHQTAAPLPERAQRHHISQSALARLLGGGYHFINGYCLANTIPFKVRLRPDGCGTGRYLHLEHAAIIWAVYQDAPPATENHESVISVAHRAGIKLRQTVYENMTPAELKTIQAMRAQRPAGRVLDHVPSGIGERLVGRLSAIVLPPHLLPATAIDRILPLTYSGAMSRVAKLENSRPNRLRIIGKPLTQTLYDWHTIRELAIAGGGRTRLPIDWDRLPRGPHEDDPERIAYARFIQQSIVGPAALKASAARRQEVPVFDADHRLRTQLPVVPYIGIALTAEVRPPHLRQPVHDVLQASAPSALARAAEQAETPEVEWRTEAQLAHILGVMVETVKHVGIRRRLRPDDHRSDGQKHQLSPARQAFLGQQVIRDRLSKLPLSQLSPEQIAVITAHHPDTVARAIGEHTIQRASTEGPETYNGSELHRLLGILGVSLA